MLYMKINNAVQQYRHFKHNKEQRFRPKLFFFTLYDQEYFIFVIYESMKIPEDIPSDFYVCISKNKN